MIKKISIFVILVFSILLLTGAVCGAEIKDSDSKKVSSSESTVSKKITSFNGPIKKISISKSTFKAGTKIKVKVSTTKSIKSVSSYVSGKNTYKLKKTSNGNWYYNLKTNKFKTGKYKLNIKAIDSKKKVHKEYVYLTVDNVAPKFKSVKSSVKEITAGNPFFIEAVTDKTSKKVIAKVRGKTIPFKSCAVCKNNTKGYNSSNTNNWTLNAKINYKEIGNLAINVYVYDSVGNVAKKTLYVKSNPVYVFWDGTLLRNSPIKAYYSNPSNAYQKSVNVLKKYVTVYEGYAGNSYTLGITYNNGNKATRVIIAYKDPFVVYHEMGHVLNWKWTEYQCDLYAYKKIGYWIL